jgi:hypothetical protein
LPSGLEKLGAAAQPQSSLFFTMESFCSCTGAFLHIAAWAEQALESNWSKYVAGSKARDILDRFRQFFEARRQALPTTRMGSSLELVGEALRMAQTSAVPK